MENVITTTPKTTTTTTTTTTTFVAFGNPFPGPKTCIGGSYYYANE